MTNNTIITIGRQYGSAGREIGRLVAEELGIKCYDKELLKQAAKESGLCEEIFENHDEKPTNSFLYSLVMDTYSLGYNATPFVDMPLNHKVFLAQFDAIKSIADKESCIMVGRFADYALADYPNCIKLFIYADMDARIKRISRIYDLSESKAKDLIVKTDKSRESYYNYYTSKKWGKATSYDLCINSSKLGVEGTKQLIIDYVNNRKNAKMIL